MKSVSRRSNKDALLLLMMVLAACQSSPGSVEPAATPAPPNPLPSPSPTRVPTRLAPTATVPAPTATVGPTATPRGQLGPRNFPPDVNPLTGEVVPDPSVLDRHPLAIKVSNAPACVRPQAGLSAADLVFEHLAEGGTTRFTAIFYGQNPGRVGSVRSARFIDLELPAMYDALFAYAGASIGVAQRLNRSDFKERIITPYVGCPPFCRIPIEETACGLSEHTLFTNAKDLWAHAEGRGLNTRPELGGMVFDSEPPSGGEPVREIVVSYNGSFVQWLYDKGRDLYFRVQDGASHEDKNNGATVTAANVVVVLANHVVTDVIEDKVGYDPQTGQGGNYSIQIQLWGQGDAYLFRDGQVFKAKWVRFGRTGELGIVTGEDHYLPFRPGNTWFQLVPLDSPVTVDGEHWRIKPKRVPDTPFGP